MPEFDISKLNMVVDSEQMFELKFYKDYMIEEEDRMYEYYQSGVDPDFDFRYELKHMKVNTFLDAWKYVKTLSKGLRRRIIEEGYFKHIGYTCNWTLMSRKCDFNDEEFIKTFSYLMDMEFAKKYNSSYPNDKKEEVVNPPEVEQVNINQVNENNNRPPTETSTT